MVLYFDRLASCQPMVFRFQLKAKFPVKAQAPGASACRCNEPEVRDETRPAEITVT